MADIAKRVFIKTYGCQMNVYDSERIKDILTKMGYQEAQTEAQADLVILNTCHIREKATEKVYSELGRLRVLQEKRMHSVSSDGMEKKNAPGSLKSMDQETKEKKNKNRKSVVSESSGSVPLDSSLRQFPEKNKMRIAVVGCTAQAEGAEIKKRAPVVDLVIGPQSYQNLPEMIKKIERGEKVEENINFDIQEKFKQLNQPRTLRTPSAFVTIQEGCDKFCTFCVVPYTRGAEVSRPVEDIFQETRRLVEKGAKEITLLGQNVNAYRASGPFLHMGGASSQGEAASSQGKKESSFWGLGQLVRYLAQIKGLKRLRFTTSHPRDMHEDLFVAFQEEPKLMPYLHLPLQSGSDKILKAMNRQHRFSEYEESIARLREIRPDLAISGDFIVGFPGETDADFAATLQAVKTIGYAQAFSFKYSPRPGTPGALKKEQIPETIKSERLSELQNLLRAQQVYFNQKQIGKTLPVLFERKGRGQGQIQGRSPYLQSVYTIAPEALLGQIIPVYITGASQNSLTGEIRMDSTVVAA